MVFGFTVGVLSTLFVVRFKESLLFWKKRVETDVEKALRGEKK